MTDIRVTSGELARFIVDVFHALGMNEADAATAADVLVWANLRGVDTHGVMRLPTYVDWIRKGTIDPTARPEVKPLLDATFMIESRRSAGAVAMKLAVERVIEVAATCGVGLGLVSDCTHTGAVGYYARQIAARGQAAIIITAGPPFMAYHGARVTSLATSPITIAVPSDGEPLLLDMASSLVSNGRLRQAAAVRGATAGRRGHRCRRQADHRRRQSHDAVAPRRRQGIGPVLVVRMPDRRDGGDADPHGPRRPHRTRSRHAERDGHRRQYREFPAARRLSSRRRGAARLDQDPAPPGRSSTSC